MDALSIVFALALVFANAFFVAIEFALVKVRISQLEAMAEQGSGGAKVALMMRRNLGTWLSASQVGITLASLALGWVGEPAFAHLVLGVLDKLGVVDPSNALVKSGSVVFAFGCITFLHIIVGEQVPKTLAIAQSERTAAILAWPMRAFYFVAFPLIWILNKGTTATLTVMGLGSLDAGEHEGALDEDELKLIFTSSVEAGALDKVRAELLERALSMMQKTARQILVPRSQMKCIDLDLPLEENIAAAYASGHTWLPVIRGSLDRVEGLINAKEFFFVLSRGELRSLGQIQRPVLFVPENVTLEQLLAEFKRRNKQVAVVVDEHGGTSGLVSLADVVAEIVGNVAELGRKVEPVKTLPGGRLELPGTAQLDDLEHTLEIEFDVDKSQVTTIAGYLMAKLGRVPVAGDVWTREPFRIVAIKVEGPRVVTVRVEPRQVQQPALTH